MNFRERIYILSCLIQEFICIDRYTFICVEIMYEK